MSVARDRVLGTSVKRRQDVRLVQGLGSYTADVIRPRTLHMAILRSREAHARLIRIDARRALALAGVVAVITGRDLGDLRPLPVLREGPNLKCREHAVLATDKVRYVGEAIAAVLAEDRYVAEDALDLIDVEYEVLPAVVDLEHAIRPGAPLIHETWGDNVANALVHTPPEAGEAFAAADVVVTRRFRVGRLTALPLEGRAVMAEYDRHTERLTLWDTQQAPHLLRTHLAETLGLPESAIRVIARDIGGGFGQKIHFYPEEVLAAVLAIRLRRPVTWIETRRESFFASVHARDQLIDLTIGAKRDGRLVAMKARILADVGAHLHTKGSGPVGVTADSLTGAYDIPSYSVEAYSVVTNKVPFGSYRGFGAPQAYMTLETTLDALAATLGIDPAALRLRNLLTPSQLPGRTPLGTLLDSGDYPEALRRALKLSAYDDWRREQQKRLAEPDAKLIGIGVSVPLQLGGLGSCVDMREKLGITNGGYEAAVVRMEPTGRVTVASGLTEIGQGLNTALAQICAEELGLDVELVDVIMGDTDVTPYSAYGTAANRGVLVGGVATLHASRQLRRKIVELAAHRLEAGADDIEIVDGSARVRGVPVSAIRLAVLARDLYMGQHVPQGWEPSLEARFVYDQEEQSHSYAAYVAVVEIDRETWGVRPLEVFVVHDCGTPINPRQIEGQIIGGGIAGLGEALCEHIRYDDTGQPLVTTLMDYALLTAQSAVPFTIQHMITPSLFNPNGAKAAGDGGVVGVPAAVVAAIADAVRPLNISIEQCPITPEMLAEAARRTM
jgi:carbon-monoxide dehydrogenase large subunit